MDKKIIKTITGRKIKINCTPKDFLQAEPSFFRSCKENSLVKDSKDRIFLIKGIGECDKCSPGKKVVWGYLENLPGVIHFKGSENNDNFTLVE